MNIDCNGYCMNADVWLVHPAALDFYEIDYIRPRPPASLPAGAPPDMAPFVDEIMLVLNAVDAYDVYWGLTDIEDWWTTSNPNIPNLERGWGDGSYFDVGKYEAREFTVNGFYRPNKMKPGIAGAARDRLIRACNMVHKQGLFVTRDWDDDKFTIVELAGAPKISTTRSDGYTEFAIPLRAPDPRKFSVWVSRQQYYGGIQGDPNQWTYFDVLNAFMPSYSTIPKPAGPYSTYRELLYSGPTMASGSMARLLRTKGNYRSDVAIEITGLDDAGISSADPIVIANHTTGQRVKIVRNPAGQTIVIDTNKRDVKVGNTWGQRPFLSLDSDWMQLHESPNFIELEPSVRGSGNGQMTLIYRDTWIG